MDPGTDSDITGGFEGQLRYSWWISGAIAILLVDLRADSDIGGGAEGDL